MDLKEKVEKALRRHFQVERMKLVDNDGISGFVVSPDFKGVATLDRQHRIARALLDPSVGLTRREQRRVLIIAPLTPVEFDLFVPDGDEQVDSDADSETSECFPDLLPKVEQVLRSRFRVDHLRLEDDDGIYGSVVSPDFEGLSSRDRQTLIDRTFRDPPSNLTDHEWRRIKFIMMRPPAAREAKLFWDSLDGPPGPNPNQSSGDGSIAPSSAEVSHRRQSDR
jgi:stress-induced morphogen